MKKLISLAIGFGIGALIGAVLVVMFAPVSGETLVKNLKEGYAETMEEARDAAGNRRKELEAELKARRGVPTKAIQKAR